jgi:PKD repeat protein
MEEKEVIKSHKIRPIWPFLFTIILVSAIPRNAALEASTAYIDEHNRFILDGEPFFPLGLYVAQCSIYDQSVQLDEIASSPFDTLMNYAVNTCSGVKAEPAEIISYLDQLDSGLADSRNLKLIYALNEYIPYDPQNQLDPCGDIDINAIQNKVGNPDIRNHDAVISWYLNDEVGSYYNATTQADCLAQLEAGYDKIKELDPNHPVWSVHWNTDWLLPEAHTTDILGVNSYPIAHLPITEVARVAVAAAQVGAETSKPFWLVPQIFDWSNYPGDPVNRDLTGRSPTQAEMRAMTYIATNHGAKGLIYYSFFDLLDGNGDFTVDGQNTWDEIKAIASDEMDPLRPVFLSTYQTSGNEITCDNPNIDFKLMWDGDRYYLFAVNIKRVKIDSTWEGVENNGVSFQINLVNKPSELNTLFENDRWVSVINGNVTDDFGPYQVHVYYWQGSFEEEADFTAYPTTGTAPLAVEFSDQSTRTDETTWAWNFGDGGTSTERNPSHTYNDPGDFSVSLMVTGLGGTDTETKADYIHVEPESVTNIAGTGGGGGGGGCFISSAAFGS